MKTVVIALVWVVLLSGLTSSDLAHAAPLLDRQDQNELEKLKALITEQQKQIEELRKQAPAGKPGADGRLSLKDIKNLSASGFSDADIHPDSLAALMGLYKLRDLEKCLVKFTHWVLIEREAAIGSGRYIFERQGYVLLLGQKDGKVVGLTRLCSIDFKKGINLDDPRIDADNPAFVVGLMALEVPGENRRDFYLVDHETPRLEHDYLKKDSKYLKEFIAKAGVRSDFFPDLLRSGDIIKRRALGRNDLAFVTFDRKKVLGIYYKQPNLGGAGIEVTDDVAPESPAASARIRKGDTIVEIQSKPLVMHENGNFFSPEECKKRLDAILSECAFNQAIPVRLYRGNTTLTRYLVFEHPGNFITEGKVNNLGLANPERTLDILFSELDKLSVLGEEFTAHCSWCVVRADKAKGATVPNALDKTSVVLDCVTTVAALLGLQKIEYISFKLNRAVRFANELNDLLVEVRRGVQGAKDFTTYLDEHLLVRAPAEFNPGDVNVLSGDSIEIEEQLGGPNGLKGKRRMRLAYVVAKEVKNREFLQSLMDFAYETGASLIALPDGEDQHGITHVHLFIKRPRDGSQGEQAPSGDLLLGYVNLLMVAKGEAKVMDLNAEKKAENNPTRFVLKGLRVLEKLR